MGLQDPAPTDWSTMPAERWMCLPSFSNDLMSDSHRYSLKSANGLDTTGWHKQEFYR